MNEELFIVILKYDIFEIDSCGDSATIQDYIAWLNTLSPERLKEIRKQAHSEYD